MATRRSARLSGSSNPSSDSPEPARISNNNVKAPTKTAGAKRKSLHDEEDNNPNGKGKGRAGAANEKVVKKSKKDPTRPLNGEKLPSGLVIMRTAPLPLPRTSTAPSSSSQMPPPSFPPPRQTRSPSPTRTSSQPKSTTSQSKPGSSLQAGQRAAKQKFGLGNKSKGKGKATRLDMPELPEIDEDVRAMEGELSDLTLREQEDLAQVKQSGLTSSSISWPRRPNFASSFSRGSDFGPSDTFSRIRDATIPLPIHDTPLIEKNKVMRRDHQERRRTSLGMRGRRASGSLTGTNAIAPPHPTVTSRTFYKHISSEIPEPIRARQLLYWCLSRCSSSTDEKPLSSSSHTPVPPLDASSAEVLKDVQDEVLRQLAMGNIDTSIWSSKEELTHKKKGKKKLKEHEQNVKNRMREKEWGKAIERCQVEDAAWSELIQSYNGYQASVVSSLSSKENKESKEGPSRAWMSEVESPWKGAFDLARQEARDVDETSSNGDSEVVQRLGGIEHQIDNLHALTHTTSQLTQRTESHLSKFFASLSDVLSSHPSNPSQSILSDPTSSLVSSLQPPASTSSDSALDLLRALSRLPPPSTAGSSTAGPSQAALRAAKDIREGVGERRLTAVPPTPSKRSSGTPRRTGSTPGRKGG